MSRRRTRAALATALTAGALALTSWAAASPDSSGGGALQAASPKQDHEDYAAG